MTAITEVPVESTGPVLEVRDLVRSFEGVRAVRGVSFALHPGEIVGLVGENGAGKSTLVKMLTGVTQPDSGTILLRGTPVRLTSPRAARAAGIAAMFQEPLIFPDLDVTENIMVGRQPAHFGLVDWKATREEAERGIKELGIPLNPRQLGRELSVAQRQLVEIVKALSHGATLLVLDEPTAVLSAREVSSLLRIVRSLRDNGTSILYISHRLDEVMELTDRIVVLRDGQKVVDLRTSETSMGELIRYMVGKELTALIPPRSAPPGPEVVLKVDHLTRSGYFEDVSFELHRGEVLGLFGLIGAGRTELAESLFGIAGIDSGTITLEGHRFQPRSPRHAIASGLAYAPENRLLNGLIASLPIRLNLVMSIWHLLSRLGMVRDRLMRRRADGLAQQVRLQRGDPGRPASTLSGGNQQKVVLGKWLASSPKVLILDEPTHGIDVGSKSDVLSSVDRLAASGVGVILISSEIEEVKGMADRVLVMHAGSISGEFQTPVSSELLLSAAYRLTGSQQAAV